MLQQLEKFTFVSPIRTDAIVELNGARRAILPVFRFGLTKLVDDRSFKMEEQDFSILKNNLAKKQTVCPILFEHGNSPRGGIAGGKVISLQEKDGEILAHATLTKKAFEECREEEWMSVSGGFLASRDEDNNIRPVSLLEISLTNLPAMPGLGPITTFAVLTPKESEVMSEPTKGPESQAEVTSTSPPVAEEAKLEATPAVTPVTEVAVEPVVTAPEVPLQVQIDALKALVDRLTQPAPVAEPAVMEAKPEEVVALTTDQTENVIEMVATARFDEKVKKEKIVVLMALGEADGKIIPSNKVQMEKLCTSDPDAFEVVLATMKPILPTKKTITDAVIKVDLGLLDQSPEHEATILTKAFQLKAKHPELNITELTNLVKNNI